MDELCMLFVGVDEFFQSPESRTWRATLGPHCTQPGASTLLRDGLDYVLVKLRTEGVHRSAAGAGQVPVLKSHGLEKPKSYEVLYTGDDDELVCRLLFD